MYYFDLIFKKQVPLLSLDRSLPHSPYKVGRLMTQGDVRSCSPKSMLLSRAEARQASERLILS